MLTIHSLDPTLQLFIRLIELRQRYGRWRRELGWARGLSEWDLYGTYGTSIALLSQSFDPSLFAQLIAPYSVA